MKYKKWIGAAILAVIAVFVFAAAGEEDKDKEALLTAKVTRGNIESTVTAQGKLEPKEYVDVGAQVSGQLTKLRVELGDTVKTGELIAEIDPEIYETQVQGNEANLKTLQAQRLQQQAELEQMALIAKRNETLIKAKAVSQEALEAAQANYKIAKAKLQALNAQIDEAKSTLEGNRAKLNYTKIYAPMNGTVVSQTAREGETLNANQTTPTIVRVADLDVMTVRAQVAEADINKIQEKMPVYFTTLGGNGRRWKGTVRQVLPTPEIINDVVLFNVLVDVENKDRQLMTSMSAQMFFVLGHEKDTLLIPVAALGDAEPSKNTDKTEAYYVNVQDGKKTEERLIQIGLQDRQNASVTSGLNEDDIVVYTLAPKANKGDWKKGMARRGGML